MKLRVRHNSIRLRLMRGEVASLAATGKVTETIEFGPSENERFTFELLADANAETLNARMVSGRITVVVPSADVQTWAENDQVGMSQEQPLGDGRLLRVLVEKDFACLEPRPGDEDADAFPNPGTSNDA